MAIVVKKQDFLINGQRSFMKPIIYCNSDEKLEAKSVALNIILAEKLSKIKAKRRTMRLETCFREAIAALPDDVVIKDFDVLFNPSYQIDLLKMFVETCKIKPFRVLWPGCFDECKLTYSEEGYKDYKEFYVVEYDITCVI